MCTAGRCPIRTAAPSIPMPHAYRCPYSLQVKKKLEEVKAKKEASNPDDYLPDGIDR